MGGAHPTRALHACLQSDILLLILNHYGQYLGHFWSLESTNFAREVTQLERRDDTDFQFTVSQAIVRGKLANSKQLLLRLNRQRKNPEVERAIAWVTPVYGERYF